MLTPQRHPLLWLLGCCPCWGPAEPAFLPQSSGHSLLARGSLCSILAQEEILSRPFASSPYHTGFSLGSWADIIILLTLEMRHLRFGERKSFAAGCIVSDQEGTRAIPPPAVVTGSRYPQRFGGGVCCPEGPLEPGQHLML